GSGTYVPRTLPEEVLPVRPTGHRSRPGAAKRRGLSCRGELLAGASTRGARSAGTPRPFRPGIPALDAFPFDVWMRLLAQHQRRPTREMLNYDYSAGHAPLRRAIAAHLGPARAVRCDADQVIVISGAQQGLDLIARLLLDPGDAVWIEDPGYRSARAAL